MHSKLSRKERLAAAWFGPKGFASVVYALVILEAGIAPSDELFHLAALVITASILAHSSTDVIVARWFDPRESADASLPASAFLPPDGTDTPSPIPVPDPDEP